MPERYSVTQEQIDQIVLEDLSAYPFLVRPVYNARIRMNGKTSYLVYPSGRTEVKSIEIGKQDSPRRDFLIDTILHEWLEAEILAKQWIDEKYSILHRLSDEKRHKWIQNEIKKYFMRRGDAHDLV